MANVGDGNSMPAVFSPTTKTRKGEFNDKKIGVRGRSLGDDLKNKPRKKK